MENITGLLLQALKVQIKTCAEDEALDALEESGVRGGHLIVGELEEPKILSRKSKEFESRMALCPVTIQWLLAKK